MVRDPKRATGKRTTQERGGRTIRRWLDKGGPRISAVLLAAGTSSRFAGTKQLAMVDDKTTLVGRAVDMLKRSRVGRIVVVLGNQYEEVREGLGDLGERVRVVVNPGFKSGLSSSLKTGLMAVSEDSDALVIALADQPLVTSQLIDEIISRFLETGCAVVTASTGDLVTPPVLLDRSLFGDLSALEGDVGAKQIILKHTPFERVEVERDTLLDVDTRQDLEKARKKLGRLSRRNRTRTRRALARDERARSPPSSE
ncbi:MAG: nucleotidyltransferase family protein [Thaumarchaeota archaeon]|nr:nucleotidyltransferase family protein [Nitrososphaerota archaeon]